MNTNFLALAFSVFATVSAATGINAQTASAPAYHSEVYLQDSIAPAKPFSTVSTATNALHEINAKAIKNFKNKYKETTNEEWIKTHDGGYVAVFKKDDVVHRVAYNNRGNWVHSMRYYNETKLPKEVRASVKSIYYDYSITQVEEIENYFTTIYLVHLQDATTIKILYVTDEGINVFLDAKRG